MHILFERLEVRSPIPLISIVDATAEAIKKEGIDIVGLLGTRFTMEDGFYRGRLSSRFDLRVIVPDEDDRAELHRIIYEELCTGKVVPASRTTCVAIIDRLASEGAKGIVLGCTELPLLVHAGDVTLPLFDTTRIHAEAAADLALSSAR